MMKNADELIEIFSEIFLYPNFKNVERFKQILLEHKADLESSIIPRGHSAVISRLKANYHSAHTILEKIGGILIVFLCLKLFCSKSIFLSCHLQETSSRAYIF